MGSYGSGGIPEQHDDSSRWALQVDLPARTVERRGPEDRGLVQLKLTALPPSSTASVPGPLGKRTWPDGMQAGDADGWVEEKVRGLHVQAGDSAGLAVTLMADNF